VEKEIVVIGTWPDTKLKERTLFETINKFKERNFKICIISHYPLPQKAYDLVDYIIFDKVNILIPNFKINFVVNGNNVSRNMNYHGLACYMNMVSSIDLFYNKFEFMHYVEYDTLFDFDKYFENFEAAIEQNKKALFVHFQEEKYRTDLFSINIRWAKPFFPNIQSIEKYNKIFGENTILEYGLTNFLNLKTNPEDIILLKDFTITTDFTIIDDVNKPIIRNLGIDFSNAPLSLRTESVRQLSFYKAVMHMYERMKNPNIVEIGVTRKRGNLGDGDSTSIWAWFISKYGGSYFGCDISHESIEESRKLLESYISVEDNSRIAALYEMDGLEFIKNFNNNIDLLYLDSWDYTAGSNDSAIFHLHLILNAINKIEVGGCVLIDDIFDLDTFEGKGKFVIPYLLHSSNFKCIHKGYQFLFRRDF
jgi:hypothetical protein